MPSNNCKKTRRKTYSPRLKSWPQDIFQLCLQRLPAPRSRSSHESSVIDWIQHSPSDLLSPENLRPKHPPCFYCWAQKIPPAWCHDIQPHTAVHRLTEREIWMLHKRRIKGKSDLETTSKHGLQLCKTISSVFMFIAVILKVWWWEGILFKLKTMNFMKGYYVVGKLPYFLFGKNYTKVRN